jgi:serine/threonine protein kinase
VYIYIKFSYKKGNLLGEGSYGRVYQGFDEDIGQMIAIKEIDIKRLVNSKSLDEKISSFQSEIDILSKLNHKNIVKYFGTKRTEEHFHILLEYCVGGSIAKMLEVYKIFSENVIKKYTRQMLEGLEYLHAHNVIHRDIKGANILVDRDGLCKLSDFGGAKVIKDEIEFKQQNSVKGTPNWMAPETVKSLEYTRFSDIWSIGCTVIEMATGEPPWKDYKNPMAALYNLMHTSSPPEFPSTLSENCRHFLNCCLK